MAPNRIVPVDNNHPVIDLLILYLMGKMVLNYRQLLEYLFDKYLLNLHFHLHQILLHLHHPIIFR
tara:strand:+ start:356 stop:550 length:195 start_codon:yes stop_codon:yes gene_type:complete